MLSRLSLLTIRRAPRFLRNSHHFSPEEIEKIPPYLRNITYNDVALPQGNWQAAYDELQKTNNLLLGFSTFLLGISIYGYYVTHEFVSCPDEPAERWYPLDRFKDGDGSTVI